MLGTSVAASWRNSSEYLRIYFVVKCVFLALDSLLILNTFRFKLLMNRGGCVMKRVVVAGAVLAGVAWLAFAGAAAAADLSRPQPYVKAPAYVPPPVFTWTGFYLGINGGGGWGRSTWDRTGSFDMSGGLVGVTAGYNWQINQAVFGVEADGDWSGIKGTTTNLCPLGCTTKTDWLTTFRGRLGYAFDRFLPYVTGGLAAGDFKTSTPGFTGMSQTNVGWTAGIGAEYAFTGNWSAKVEYLHVDLGRFNCGLSCGVTTADNVSYRPDIVRGGINYHF
jgi:outer membrane immunogenic protein